MAALGQNRPNGIRASSNAIRDRYALVRRHGRREIDDFGNGVRFARRGIEVLPDLQLTKQSEGDQLQAHQNLDYSKNYQQPVFLHDVILRTNFRTTSQNAIAEPAIMLMSPSRPKK